MFVGGVRRPLHTAAQALNYNMRRVRLHYGAIEPRKYKSCIFKNQYQAQADTVAEAWSEPFFTIAALATSEFYPYCLRRM
jgi:hypothetical protein